MDDSELLRTYVETGSEQAFAELVEKRLPLVYSAALRQTGDSHRAQEVTQMVFTDLSRKAKKLVDHPALIAWLHRSTKWAACDLLRAERRRGLRDGTALQVDSPDATHRNGDWEQLRPVIDESLDKLGQLDRTAVLLRFFEGLRYAEVGARLNMSEVAARIRVKRSLEKLRSQLARHGVTSAASALELALTNNVIAATPPWLAQSIASSVLSGATATQNALVSSKVILFSKFNLSACGVGLVLTFGLFWQQQRNAPLLGELGAAQERSAVSYKALLAADRALAAERAALAEIGGLSRYTAPFRRPLTPREKDRAQWLPVALRLELDSEYAPLFRRLHLAPDKLDKFKQLLVERKQALSDAQMVAAKEGFLNPLPNESEWRVYDAAAGSDIDAQILAEIGETAFGCFVDYRYSGRTRRKLGELADRLKDTSTPLRDEQIDTVVDFLKNDPGHWARVDSGDRISRAEIEAAALVFEPAQMAMLREIQTANEAYNGLMQRNKEAALTGKVALRQSPPLPKVKSINLSPKLNAAAP